MIELGADPHTHTHTGYNNNISHIVAVLTSLFHLQDIFTPDVCTLK